MTTADRFVAAVLVGVSGMVASRSSRWWTSGLDQPTPGGTPAAHDGQAPVRRPLTDLDARSFAVLYDKSPIGIALVTPDGRLGMANQALQSMLAHGAVGDLLADLVIAEDRALMSPVLGPVPATLEVRLATADGGSAVQLHVAPLPDVGSGWMVQVLDVSERTAHEARLRELADEDSLTGLHNRRRFGLEMSAAIERSHADGATGALLLADLDAFKQINDSLGHLVGDATLKAIAASLRGVVPPGSVIARIGGDEFAILVEGDLERAHRIAASIVGALRNRTRITGDDQPVLTASIGIAMYGDGDSSGAGCAPLSTDDLMARAGLAMQEAKAAGRNRIAVYDPRSGRREAVAERQRWITRLRDPAGHLVAHAQPIVPVGGGDGIRRIELLVRYRAGDDSLIAPSAFLDVAEQTGLVGDIDRWMIRQAADLILSSREPLQVAVNVSAQTFADPTLPRYIDTVFGRDVPDGALMIELTETAALADAERISTIAEALHLRGCQVALDDFGSGFATFAHLRLLRFDVLKIDGTFVRDVATDSTHRLIVQAIVTMAAGLGLPVIAEHVEDQTTLDILTEMGVAYAQGYFLGRPGPTVDVVTKPVIGG